MQSNKSNRAIPFTLLTENFILKLFIRMKFTITKSELWFLSDLLAGAQTPGALLAIGNFVGHPNVSSSILGYQKDLNDLVEGQKISLGNLAKEYFEQDENGSPKIEKVTDPSTGEAVDKWVIIEGKDESEFQAKYHEATTESMKTRNDLGLTEVSIDIEDSVFYNFKQSLMNDVRIVDASRALGVKSEQDQQNFIGVLYNVLAKLDTISA